MSKIANATAETEKRGCYAAAMAFMNGPDFNVIAGEEGDVEQRCLESAAAAPAAAYAEPAAEVEAGGWRSGITIDSFNKAKQVYSKEELSPLPFQPPVFFTYATTMLSGAFKVFQYVITIMVALMVTQHALQRYWSMSGQVSTFQALMFTLFLSYPMITLLLVTLSNNEMAVRRFMYYRLMSLQIIVDWKNTPFYRLWFFAYFAASFVLINVYSLYAGVLTRDDKTSSVFPQWSIMVLQSLLLFMYWLNLVSMEEQLVPLNKFIENWPSSAKELITRCDVVTEHELKAVLRKAYKRMRAFRNMSGLQQDEAGRELLQTGCGPAAFFDLLALRKTARNRAGQEAAASAVGEEEEQPGCCGWLHDLWEWLEDLTLRKLYAWNFCMEYVFSLHFVRWRRSGADRAAASLWPYAADRLYFFGMAVVGLLCFFTVLAVEAYALWFLMFARDISDRDRYGILECRQCYAYHIHAGDTCSGKAASDSCWGAAKLGYCAMQDALQSSYHMNITQSLTDGSCAYFLPAV
ncbi:hypothetical protein OEZ85_013980 [Tetradesmus obliquus]|uniref:Uncharacterized protein n=2 Tax=Tetradesmus obliquus TaxID=3088 RepID=A0ABY8U6I3_TETOB|nr:hypothetical protein OEZ85_013980 [Tetradesmus obliquus]